MSAVKDVRDLAVLIYLVFVIPMLCIENALAEEKNDGDLKDYCETDIFSPQCQNNEVIIIKQARYGRMKLGNCVKTDYGFVGCEANVLSILDGRCSGKRQCTVRIPDTSLDEQHKCPAEFKTYLEAAYTCAVVESIQCQMCQRPNGVAKVTDQKGNIGSIVTSESNNGCGSTTCPWVIELQPGQKINITLRDFGLAGFSETGATGNNCIRYANIKEKLKDKEMKETPICGGIQREAHVYLSQTHSIEIHVVSPEAFSKRGQFIFSYEAVGCPDYETPDHTWLTREDGTVTIKCISNPQTTWQLFCDGTKWKGELGTCPNVHTATNTPPTTLSLPLGVLIAIIIGIALVIGVLILTVGLVCLKRQHQSVRHPQETQLYGRRRDSEYKERPREIIVYSKKPDRSPDVEKRLLPPNMLRENVYMERRPLPSIPNLNEVDELIDKTRVQIHRTNSTSARDHYHHNPRLMGPHGNRYNHMHPECDPQYFVLDPEDDAAMAGPSQRVPRGITHAHMHHHRDRQKSPEEENLENSDKESSKSSNMNTSLHEFPPRYVSHTNAQPAKLDADKGNCSWP